VLEDLKRRISITVFLIIVIVIPVFAAPRAFFPITHAQSETNLTGIIIPLYSYPGNEWREVANIKEAYPLVPIVAVINPDNGPGTSQDPNYVSGIGLLHSAGVTVVGYVYTSYAARPITSVIANINSWKQMYKVNGIFFDQMSNVPGYENYYSSLNSYAASLGYTITIGNPGAAVPASYIGTLDNILIYENVGLPSISYLSSLGYQKSDFSSVSYGVPTIDSSFLSSSSAYLGYVYVTDQNMPNPYTTLPSYFETLVSTLSQIDSLPTTVSVTIQTVDMSGNQIQGLWTVVQSGGATFQTGFSPMSFTATSGVQYEVTVSNYGNDVFSHWSTGSTSNTITITPSQATTLVAYYNVV